MAASDTVVLLRRRRKLILSTTLSTVTINCRQPITANPSSRLEPAVANDGYSTRTTFAQRRSAPEPDPAVRVPPLEPRGRVHHPRDGLPAGLNSVTGSRATLLRSTLYQTAARPAGTSPVTRTERRSGRIRRSPSCRRRDPYSERETVPSAFRPNHARRSRSRCRPSTACRRRRSRTSGRRLVRRRFSVNDTASCAATYTHPSYPASVPTSVSPDRRGSVRRSGITRAGVGALNPGIRTRVHANGHADRRAGRFGFDQAVPPPISSSSRTAERPTSRPASADQVPLAVQPDRRAGRRTKPLQSFRPAI